MTTTDATTWLDGAVVAVSAEASAIGALFPAVSRRVGRGPVDEGDDRALRSGSVDDAARVRLLEALPLSGDALVAEVTALYRHGDAHEKRGVLRALSGLAERDGVGDRFLPLVEDGLRSNDVRIVAAAVQDYAALHLPDAAWRQAVLKCVFVGVPLEVVAGLARRGDADLARMLVSFAHERIAAGRDVPADIWPVVDAHPSVLEESGLAAELESPVPERRDAARRALADRPIRRPNDIPNDRVPQEG